MKARSHGRGRRVRTGGAACGSVRSAWVLLLGFDDADPLRGSGRLVDRPRGDLRAAPASLALHDDEAEVAPCAGGQAGEALPPARCPRSTAGRTSRAGGGAKNRTRGRRTRRTRSRANRRCDGERSASSPGRLADETTIVRPSTWPKRPPPLSSSSPRFQRHSFTIVHRASGSSTADGLPADAAEAGQVFGAEAVRLPRRARSEIERRPGHDAARG